MKKIATSLDLSSNRISNLGIGTEAADAVNKSQLDEKVTANTSITGATNTKITYDSKGLVLSGTTLNSSDIPNIAISQVNDLQSNIDSKQPKIYTATTDTASATAAKTVTVSGWTPAIGDLLMLNFSLGSTVNSVTLSVNGGTAYALYLNNSAVNTSTFYMGANSSVLMYFDGTYWRVIGNQDSSDTDTYDRVRIAGAQKVGATVTRYKILSASTDGLLYPLTIGDNTITTNTVATTQFLLHAPFFWHYSSTTLAANSNTSTLYSSISLTYFQLNFNSPTMIYAVPVYIKAINNNDGTWSMHEDMVTQTLPSTEDGYLYILLGIMSTGQTSMTLIESHPIYEYKDGAIREFTDYHTHDIADVNGLQDALDAKADSNSYLPLSGGIMTGNIVMNETGRGIEFGTGSGTVGYIRRNAAEGQIDIGSDNFVNFVETDVGTTAVTIATNTGTVTATSFVGDLTGNADTATTLETARTISLTGDVTGSGTFDGSANLAITATVADDSHNHVISNVDGLQDALDLKANDSPLIKKAYSLDLTALSNTIFYPVIFSETEFILDCEIYSSGGSASLAYNQNIMHFNMTANGWNDTPVQLSIITYDQYTASEITIGCIGYGTEDSGHKCVWLRGGILYKLRSNQQPYLYTTGYTFDNSVYSIGSNYYGGTNAYVNIAFTPQTTMIRGAYFSDGVTSTVFRGNADTTTKLQTARTISLSGDVTGSGSFDGSANLDITATVADDSHNHIVSNVDGLQDALDSKMPLTGGTLTGPLLGDTFSGRNLILNTSYNYNSAYAGYKHTNAKKITSAVNNRYGFSSTNSSYTTGPINSAEYYAVSFWYKIENHTSGTLIAVDINDTGVANITLADCDWTFFSGVAYITTHLDMGFMDISGTFVADIYVSDIVVTRSAKPSLEYFPAPEDKADITSLTDGSVTKVGTSTVGSGVIPMYLSSGTPTASTSTVGSSTKPVYLNAGTITASTSTVGSSTQPVYLNAGTVTAITGTINNNAATATKLATARTVSLTGDVTGSGSFDGSANLAITATVVDDSHNHVISNIDDLQTTLDSKINSSLMAVANGVATLDSNGLVPSAQLPSYVDDVLEYTNLASFPATGESGKIYVALDTNKTYRWSGSAYIYITSGAVDSVNGQTGIVSITTITGNAGTATKLATARTISLTGDVTGSGSFDGSANLAITATVVDDSHNHVISNVDNLQTALDAKADLVDLTDGSVTKVGTATVGSDVIPMYLSSGTPTASTSTVGSSTQPVYLNAGTITAITGTINNNAATATKLATARTISLTGDVTGSGSFDGSANLAITATVADDSHNHIIDNVDGLQNVLDTKANQIYWTNTITCATWSRILALPTSTSTLGHAFILNVSATRANVVYNTTFHITTSHSAKCNIVQLNNTSYSTFSIRGVVDVNGNGFIELYDVAHGATSTTTQFVHLRVTKLDNKDFVQYSTFTDGTTIPDGYTVKGEITTVTGATLVADLAGNADTATTLETARTLTISDSTGTYTGSSVSFDGSSNITLPLPSTATIGNTVLSKSLGASNFYQDCVILLCPSEPKDGTIDYTTGYGQVVGNIYLHRSIGHCFANIYVNVGHGYNWSFYNGGTFNYEATSQYSNFALGTCLYEGALYHCLKFSCNMQVETSIFNGYTKGTITLSNIIPYRYNDDFSTHTAGEIVNQEIYDSLDTTTYNILPSTYVNTHLDQTITAKKTFNNNIAFSNIDTGARGIYGTIGSNDHWAIRGISTATNAGALELSTGDDGTEPIYARQYTGTPESGTIKRTLTLLDASGNTSIPGALTVTTSVTAPAFYGIATSANQVNPISLSTQDLNDYRTGTVEYVAGGGNTVLNKPSGVNAFGMTTKQVAGSWYIQILHSSDANQATYTRYYTGTEWTDWKLMYDELHPQITLAGNADTATALETARTISLTGDVTGSGSFDGSADLAITATVADNSHNHNEMYRIDISGGTLDLDALNHESEAKTAYYIERSDSGSTNITNTPNAYNRPFILDVESIRWASASDYVTKQTFTQSITGTGRTYYRWCHSGTWTEWYRLYSSEFIDSEPTDGSTEPVTSNGVYDALTTKIDKTSMGIADGVATLDSNGLIPSTQLPSYVDDVLEYTNLASFPATGESGKIYVALDTNKTYRWSGSAYIYITSGAVDSVNGQTGVVSITTITGNAGTATKLATARTISLTGDVTGSGSFDGSANLAITATVVDDSHNHVISNVDNLQTALDAKADLVDLTDGSVTKVGTATVGSGVIPMYLSSGTPTASTSTVGSSTKPVYLNAGTITASTSTVGSSTQPVYLNAGTVTAITGTIANNAATATKLATARTISLTGDVTGSGSFDGSANLSITATVVDDSHNHVISNVDGLQTALNTKVTRYTLPTYSSKGYMLLGRFTASQVGHVIRIQLSAHSGHNANSTQTILYDIYFKTSNGSSVNDNGFAGDSSFGIYSPSSTLSYAILAPKWVGNAAGVDATYYDLYVYTGAYNTNSVYSVTTSAAWEHIGTTGVSDPGDDSDLILISEENLFRYRGYEIWNSNTFPISHASSNTTYGVGSSSTYGHVKVDSTPTSGSTNAISSGAVYDELATKADSTDLTNYLPLSGGAMTGNIIMNASGRGIEFGTGSGTVGYIRRNTTEGQIDIGSDNFVNFVETDNGTTAVSISTNTGTVTATSFIGDLTGNADTATTLETARTISLTGDVTGSGSFDGSANLSITSSINATTLHDTTGFAKYKTLTFTFVSNGTDIALTHNLNLPTSPYNQLIINIFETTSRDRVEVSYSSTAWTANTAYIKMKGGTTGTGYYTAVITG